MDIYKRIFKRATAHDWAFTNSLLHNTDDPDMYGCAALSPRDHIVFGIDGTLSRCYLQQKSNDEFTKYIQVGTFSNDGTFSFWDERNRELKQHFEQVIRAKCNNCMARYSCSGSCPMHSLEGMDVPVKFDEVPFRERNEDLITLTPVAERSAAIATRGPSGKTDTEEAFCRFSRKINEMYVEALYDASSQGATA